MVAFALQGGRGSVVLPIVVAILARWLYWGRPNAYVLTTGIVLAVLAHADGAEHPVTMASIVVAVAVLLGGPTLVAAVRSRAERALDA